MARVGPAIGMPVKAPEKYSNTLNSNSQNNISPTNPIYHITMASKNMFTAIIRHGQNIYRHVMTAAFDPVYGREFSLAHEYERPATRFDLAETTRPNERSENVNLVALLGGSYIKPNKINPFQSTITIYDVRDQDKKGGEGPYQVYGNNYRRKDDDVTPTNKNALKVKANLLYKIESVAKAVEQRGREYSRKVYDAFAKRKKRGEGQTSYETGLGIRAKVAYLRQKVKTYAGKVIGYNPQSKPQEQVSKYEGHDTQIPTYILPTGYSGTAPQTSIDARIAEHETIVPQAVLDATIKDAERFLEEQRRKKRLSLVDNESELELALSK